MRVLKAREAHTKTQLDVGVKGGFSGDRYARKWSTRLSERLQQQGLETTMR